MSYLESAYEDDREIENVWQANQSENESSSFKVGRSGVTKILIYRESGQMSAVPWAAIYVGDEIKWRFDMAGWGITYKGDLK